MGAVLSRQKFDAWGNPRSDTSTTGKTPTDVGFTGQRSDSMGLMYFKARYYASSIAADRQCMSDTLPTEHT
jgi:RHS repeat-associated protein